MSTSRHHRRQRRSGLSGRVPNRRLAVAALVVICLGAACTRGPAPPEPTEDLRAATVGIVETGQSGDGVELRGGERFPSAAGVAPQRLVNWPADSKRQPADMEPGSLLLGGQRADGSWWYQLASLGNECWEVLGGAFDRGDAVQFSTGVIVPKAPGFELRTHGTEGNPFPGHAWDVTCLSGDGEAVYFDLFVGR